ncbi:hypothetical protein ACVWXL_008308 [Bradyrhizobium sp. GM22.5]
MPSGPRTNSSSFSMWRRRPSAWLTAGWLRLRRFPARVVDLSRITASKTTNRLRSMDARRGADFFNGGTVIQIRHVRMVRMHYPNTVCNVILEIECEPSAGT